ncbi:MAG TPA: LCP family protein [Solirubrobacterales bacterium]|jgi:LCP family protein required for cell wall assembly|nr:LCP family protein [Solirubrobacterales bacterium]
MSPDDEQRPPEPPDYKVYRSRRGLFSRLKGADLSGLRDRARLPSWRRRKGGDPGDPGLPPPQRGRVNPRRVLKWVGFAALAWILLSLVAFGVSAQIQSFKLSSEAGKTLHGNPFLLPSAQTILILGTDARPPGSGDIDTSQECFDQQAHGDKPHGSCEQGQFRADTLMLVRAGGGAFRKLSIPRDTFAEIPGEAPTKINAAFAFGGAALQIKTIEQFLGIQIDHVVIVDFTGFEDLVDAVGGVKVDLPHKLCADISGGAGGGQGGITLHLKKGENTLDGEKALAYSRIREPSECPGKGKSAFSFPYDDRNRAAAQQSVINGIKGRLTDPLRLPYNFIHGPFIGWEAPKAFVSDMGFFTMPQLILSAAIGGSSNAHVLCSSPKEGCGEGPEGSIEAPDKVRRAAVRQLIDG